MLYYTNAITQNIHTRRIIKIELEKCNLLLRDLRAETPPCSGDACDCVRLVGADTAALKSVKQELKNSQLL